MLLLMLLALQAPPEPRIEVASIQRQERLWRVTLKGEMDAADGDAIVLNVQPLEYRLDADGRRLIRAATDNGAKMCRAHVQKRAFTAAFTTPRLGEHDVRVTPPGATVRLALFDRAAWSSSTAEQDRLFNQHVKTIRSLVEELQPFEKSGAPVPAKLLRRLLRIEDPIRLWAEEAELSAAASVLTALLTDLGTSVPWEAQEDPSAQEATAYPHSGKRPSRPFDTAGYDARLVLAQETAARERRATALATLDRLMQLRPKDLLASVQSLRACVAVTKELDALVTDCEESARGRDVKGLAERLKLARESVESGRKETMP